MILQELSHVLPEKESVREFSLGDDATLNARREKYKNAVKTHRDEIRGPKLNSVRSV